MKSTTTNILDSLQTGLVNTSNNLLSMTTKSIDINNKTHVARIGQFAAAINLYQHSLISNSELLLGICDMEQLVKSLTNS